MYESKTTLPANTPNDNYTDKLQFAGHEEGRIRALYDNSAQPNTLTRFACDYMIKDHLGNVRMVLTEELKQNTYPAATLEGTFDLSINSMVNYEKGFYKIDDTKIVPKTSIPSWTPPGNLETVANTRLYYNNNGNPANCTPTQTNVNTNLYRLNATPIPTANKTGLEFVMKVMAGDQVDIFGKSYYLNTAAVNNSNSTTLNLASLFASFLLAPSNLAGTKGSHRCHT